MLHSFHLGDSTLHRQATTGNYTCDDRADPPAPACTAYWAVVVTVVRSCPAAPLHRCRRRRTRPTSTHRGMHTAGSAIVHRGGSRPG
eukprot:scaffold4423_cov67-Phaeocystis_antarctica.AAC.2